MGYFKVLDDKSIIKADSRLFLIFSNNIYIFSNKHEVRTLEVNKLALSNQDDKSISIDGIASYAMGHYKTK